LIAHWLEQPGEFADTEAELDVVVFTQHVLQIALCGGCLAACLLDDPVGFLLADLGCEGECNSLGHDEAARHFEVGAHAFAVDLQAFGDVDNGMTIAREEIFGPVGAIIAYDREEEAIAIANDSHYGLSGGVFTEDTDRAYAVARRIRTGNFSQNGRVLDITIPYGGFKQSGIGREGGIEGLHSFTEVKAVFLPHLPSHLLNDPLKA